MHLATSDLDAPICERLVNSIAVPRPIAWVLSVSAAGIQNLAPFSYYNIVSYRPPVAMISFSGEKHSWSNILETKEYVINVVSEDRAATMVASSFEFERDVSEVAALGLATSPSQMIGVPRLSNARAAFECRFHSTMNIGTGRMVFGIIESVFVADEAWKDGRVLTEVLRPVGRLGGGGYCVGEERFSLQKPTSDPTKDRSHTK